MDYDPFNVRQYGEKHSKWLRMLMLAVPILLVASFILFLVSFSSSHDSEVSTLNHQIEKWNQDGEANVLAEIRMMMKVLPSPGHGVVDRMQLTNSEEAVWKKSGVKSELEHYTTAYHVFKNDTSDKFPTLAFNEKMVPVGLSQEKCVFFSWAPAANADRALEYEELMGLPHCPLLQLNAHDPHVGIKAHAWKQKVLEVDCGGKSCVDSCRQLRGWWVFSKDRQSGICYAYDILDTICIKIGRVTDRFGKHKFMYTGGCYANNQTERYFPGDPGCIYEFENVTVEVRSDEDPYMKAVEMMGEDITFSTSMKWASTLSLTFFVLALLGAAAFGAGLYFLKGT